MKKLQILHFDEVVKNLGTCVACSDIFTWFLFGEITFHDRYYILKTGKTASFVDSNGDLWSSKTRANLSFIVLDGKFSHNEPLSHIFNLAIKKGYDGVVVKKSLTINPLMLTCDNIDFFVNEDRIVKSNNNAVVRKYAKKHNQCIKDVCETFPSYENVNKTPTKILYKGIKKYNKHLANVLTYNDD
jgi:hypothetical protein